MDEQNKLAPRERFLKIYANLPIPVRDGVIYVDEEKRPISWNVAYLEIEQKTELGDKILSRLQSLDII